MKKIFLIWLLIGVTSFSTSAQFFQWAKAQHSSFYGSSLACGNNIIATTGTFSQTITIGSQTFSSPDSISGYVVAHNHSGSVLWAKHIISKNYHPSVIIDQNQNIIVAGIFSDSLYIDGLIFKGSNSSKKGVYVVKFSPTGTLLWAQSSDVISGNLSQATHKISVTTDGSGNVIVGGDFKNTLTFGSTTLTCNNKSAVFLVKYDANGIKQWAINASSITNNLAGDVYVNVKANAAGEIYFTNSVTNNYWVSITKISTTGIKLWNRISAYSSTFSNVIIPNLALDNANNVYITGYIDNNIISIPGTNTIAINTKIFLIKLDVAGNWKWLRSVASDFIPAMAGGFIYNSPGIFFSPTNELALAGSFMGTAQFKNISITSSPSNVVNTFIAKLDTAGSPIWLNQITGSIAGPDWNELSNISGDHKGNFFITGSFSGNAQFGATSLSTSWIASFLTKVNNGTNSVSGSIFIDSNSNGIKDASETGYGQLMLETTPDSVYGISKPNGTYAIYLPIGTSTISLPNLPRNYTLVPTSHTVTFSGTNQTQTGKDFALQPIPNSNDVKVIVTEIMPARPGFQTKYRLAFHNSGTTVLSDTLKFSHNTSTLTFVSSSVTPATNSNGQMFWYYQNLQPNETRNIDVTFSVPTTTVLGTPLQAIASIKPFAIDLFKADNIDTLNHVVVGSYDPNDKQVDKPSLSPSLAANGEFLDYTIRFQNTGTDTAFTVIVTDRIMSKLNLAEFEMLSASHNYKLNVVDGNMLEWRFDNILLPDSNRNEPASHGFVRFRIKSKAGLVLGDSITNNAAIYFDYNAPVITNYAVTKVANPTGVKENKAANIQAFRLYPNPAKNYVIVAAEFKKNTAATVSLVNLLGQTISKVTLPANNQIHYQLPLNDLPKGVYLIRLQTETGMQTQRLVIQ